MSNVRRLLALTLAAAILAIAVPMAGASAPAAPLADQQPVKGPASVGVPAQFSPAALPTASGPVAARAQPLNTQDANAFAQAKQAQAAQPVTGPAAAGPDNAPADSASPALAALGAAAELAGGSAESPSPALPSSNKNFTGLTDTGWYPPDNGFAAGPSNLIEAVNEQVAVYGKNGARLLGPTQLYSWFGYSSSSNIFDPVIVYRGGHFYLVALYINSSTQVSQILVSVSLTNSATGGWCNYVFNGEQASTNWADFPRVGVTTNRLLIATNQFNWSTGAFEQNFLQELPKASLDTCSGFSYTYWYGFLNSDGSLGFTQVPAVDYDDFGGTAFYMTNAYWPGASKVTVWRDVLGVGWQRYDVATQAYNIPPDARQPGTSTRIATNDSRLLSAFKRYNQLWVASTTAYNPGCGFNIAALHLLAINAPASTSVAPSPGWDQYYWSDCNLDYYFPASTPEGNGNMLFAFNRSSTGEYPNFRYAGWTYAQMPGQTVAGLYGSTRLGVAPGAFTNTTGRWGDYSGISVDPQNQDFVWVSGELLQANNSWKTIIGRIYHRVPTPI